MEIDTGSLTGGGGRNARGVCLKLSTRIAARLLAFGFLATFLIGFGIGFACVPTTHAGATAHAHRATHSAARARGATPRCFRGATPRARAMHCHYTAAARISSLKRL